MPYKKEIDWLIIVLKTSDDENLKNESLQKLRENGLTDNDIDKRYESIHTEQKELKAFEKAWAKQIEANQFESYSLLEKVKIFFLGSYRLFRRLDSGLIELKRDNYKLKFKQKLILLVLGTSFWLMLFFGAYKLSEHKRMEEIEKVDLTEWENNRIK